ncbi:MAG: PEGA domain-containing protein [Myxococcaceae bacterium]|nr:PEGA domain-containing protein [Myxococcaceae bacterium]
MSSPEDEWSPAPGTPLLDESGRVIGERPADPTPGEPPDAGPSPADEGPLELQADPQKIIAEREAREREEAPVAIPKATPRHTGAIVAVMVALLVLCAGAAVLLVPELRYELDRRLPHAPTPMLKIDSEPSGATVWIEGQEVGQTPLYLDNRYPDATIRVEIARPGYERWRGTFRGGAEQAVEAKLMRSGPGKRR